MLWRRRYYHRFTLAELEIRREKRALIVQSPAPFCHCPGPVPDDAAFPGVFQAMEGSALPGA